MQQQLAALNRKDGKYPGGVPSFHPPISPPELNETLSACVDCDLELTFTIPNKSTILEAMALIYRLAWGEMKTCKLEGCKEHDANLMALVGLEKLEQSSQVAYEKFLEETGQTSELGGIGLGRPKCKPEEI